MTPEAINARREYRRKWAKENPDKVRAQQERYWAKKADMAKRDEAQHETDRAKE